MPKEQTHWILAKKAASRLEKGPIRQIIVKNPNLYYLGAVILDTPMYALHDAKKYNVLAQHLHGRWGENTFTPLTKLLKAYKGKWSDGLWALVLGAMSHILADAVYHPWIEYYTGSSTDVPENMYKLSLSRHRELETYLDLYHIRTFPEFKPKSFSGLLRKKEMGSRQFDNMINTLYFNGKDGPDPKIRKLFFAHAALQWCFMQKTLAKIAFLANRGLKLNADQWTTLFYPDQEPENPRYFEPEITYLHTVSGKPKQTTVRNLENKAVRITTRMFELIENHLQKNSAMEFFSRIKGPSLETGLVGVPSSAIVHYNLDISLDKILGVERIQK